MSGSSDSSSTVLGHQIVADLLRARGVSVAFGLLGDANLQMFVLAARDGLTFHSSRHESGAVSMAAGYAVATGEVGVVSVTKGPGVTNALTPLVSAVRDRIPLVLLAGCAATTASHDPASPRETFEPQEVDQEALARLAGANVIPVRSTRELSEALSAAFAIARGECRPVVVNLPIDLLDGSTAGQPAVSLPRAESTPVTLGASAESIAHVAELVRAARRPVVLAGRGASSEAARRGAITLADRIGALLATSLPAHGLFGEHPFSIGFSGGFAVESVRDTLRESDLVLAFGASLNRYTTNESLLFENAAVVQCDIDGSRIGRHHRVDLPLVGSADRVLGQIGESLGPPASPAVGYRTDSVRERLAAGLQYKLIPDASDLEGVDPRSVLRRVDQRLPRGRRTIVDLGHFSTFPCQHIRSFEFGQLVPCFGFGSIGLALSTSLGAAVGSPSDAVLCVVGDGGLLMSLPELETLGRLGLPVTVLVMNDRAYGAEVHSLRKLGLESDLVHFPRTDFAAIARSHGVEAITIKTFDDINLIPDLGSLTAPLLIDVHITPNVVADKFR
ncbi:MAG: Acetolactate synthase large subunit [Rhodoglobus sp.]|nr:Acetolactate synthase large subunit [Rhodoglobus sp.]